MKQKLSIIEDNTQGFEGPNSIAVSLKEDLISLLLYEGLSVPVVGQTQFEKETIVSSFSNKDNGNQSNKDISSDNSTFLQPNLPKELNNLKGNKFKTQAPFTQQFSAKTSGGVENNNLLNSLFTRRHFTNVKNNFSFKIKNITLPMEILTQRSVLPLQILCLSFETPNAEGQVVFKDFFSGNQGYIKNGVVNPSRLSEYWFGHQNIAKIEYLSGFTETVQDVSVKENTSTGALIDAKSQPKRYLI